MFNGTLNIPLFIGMNWRCIKTVISLVVYFIVTFTNF